MHSNRQTHFESNPLLVILGQQPLLGLRLVLDALLVVLPYLGHGELQGRDSILLKKNEYHDENTFKMLQKTGDQKDRSKRIKNR